MPRWVESIESSKKGISVIHHGLESSCMMDLKK